jgi:hypothetical protein
MAYTVTRKNTVFGNERAVHLDILADAATQTIETGLKVIHAHAVSIQSAAAVFKCYANSNASGVQSMGVLGLSGLTSGDRIYVTVFGV